MKIGIKEVKDGISSQQIKGLIRKLEESEFEFIGDIIMNFKRGISKARTTGHIYLKDTSAKNHPKERRYPLPIGFIVKSENGYSVELVNTERRFFQEYHEQLERLYINA